MKSPTALPTQHEAEWAQRLEEWREGLASATEATAIESHVAGCDECRDYLDALNHIDAALGSTLSAPLLSPGFDAALWARVDSNDAIQRTLAKQRAQEQMEQQLAALDSRWRRALVLLIPGVLAGIALAFWFVSLIEQSSLLAPLLAALQDQLGAQNGRLVQAVATGMLGGAAGFAMSKWFAPRSE
ncbi:MAG TPA: zf-HC2 domain-containing protein [Steroidobacteraceae bacterium]|jgi:anti-sigma factor RsiW|nr:zf-HC2 domain-containing protein [Steroidobacteraceae bacterium]